MGGARVRLSFIGLGKMGEPMAARLLDAGIPLTVWNRSAPALARVVGRGGVGAPTASEAISAGHVVFFMLGNEAALDAALGRGSAAFGKLVEGRTLVNMATVSAQFSSDLAQDVQAAGGAFVEAPVSGSSVPAASGELVAMLAGEEAEVARVGAIVGPMCARIVECGPIPRALTLKLSVNLFLVTMVAGLAEAAHFAMNHGIDLALLKTVLDAGPMASAVSRKKLEKLVQSDFAPHASISDVLMNARLVAGAARQSRVSAPLIEQCEHLFAEAEAQGLGGLDMIGVVGALEQFTSALRMMPSLPHALAPATVEGSGLEPRL